jgi:hypothetical protein
VSRKRAQLGFPGLIEGVNQRRSQKTGEKRAGGSQNPDFCWMFAAQSSKTNRRNIG